MEPLEDRTLLASYASGFTVDSNNTVLTGVGAAHVVGVGGAWGTKATITLPNFPAHTMLVVWPDPSIASSGYPRSSGTGDVDTYVLKVGDRIETFDYEFNSPSNGSSYYPANSSSYSQNVNAWFQHTGPLTIEIYGENLEAGDEGWQIGDVVVTWYLPSVSIHSQGILSEDDVAPANPSSADPGFWVERDLPSGWSPVGTPTHDIIPDTSVGLSYSGTASTSDTSILSKKYVVELSGAQSMVYVATAVDDDQIEPRETIIATLNSVPATARYILGAATTAQLEIKDNDFDFKGLELTFSDQGVKHDTGMQDLYDNNANTGGVQHWSDLDGDKQDDTGKGAPLSFRRSIPAGGGNAAQQTKIALTASVKLGVGDIAGVLGATFKLVGTGTGVGAGDYIGTITAIDAATKIAVVAITGTNALAETIDEGELSVEWKLKRTPAGKPPEEEDGGTTKNQVYVTGVGATNQFESVLVIGGAAKGLRPRNPGEANGEAKNKEVLDAIWARFGTANNSPANPTRADGTALTYWKTPNTTEIANTATLLTTGDGRCGAWADFLVISLAAQGVQASAVGIQRTQVVDAIIGAPPPQPPNAAGVGIYAVIKPIAGQGTNPPALTQFMSWRILQSGNDQVVQNSSIHVVVRVVNAGTSTANHIYDPSYGALHLGVTADDAERAWETASLAGWRWRYILGPNQYADGPLATQVPANNPLPPRQTAFQ